MLSIALQKSCRILGFSSSRIVKLLKRLSLLAKSSARVGALRVIRFQIVRISLLIRIFVLMFFEMIHVIQKHERHALKAGVDFPNFLSGRLSAENIGESTSSKLNESFLILVWLGHAVAWFIRVTSHFYFPSRQKDFFDSRTQRESNPLGGFQIWPFPAGLVPANGCVVLKTKNPSELVLGQPFLDPKISQPYVCWCFVHMVS